jgi:hypothetical protein
LLLRVFLSWQWELEQARAVRRSAERAWVEIVPAVPLALLLPVGVAAVVRSAPRLVAPEARFALLACSASPQAMLVEEPFEGSAGVKVVAPPEVSPRELPMTEDRCQPQSPPRPQPFVYAPLWGVAPMMMPRLFWNSNPILELHSRMPVR